MRYVRKRRVKGKPKCLAEQVGGLSSVCKVGKTVEAVDLEGVRKEGQELSFKLQSETFV